MYGLGSLVVDYHRVTPNDWRSIEIVKRLLSGDSYPISYLADEYDVSPRLIRNTVDEINVFLIALQIKELIPDRKQGIQLIVSNDEKKKIVDALFFFYQISTAPLCVLINSTW